MLIRYTQRPPFLSLHTEHLRPYSFVGIFFPLLLLLLTLPVCFGSLYCIPVHVPIFVLIHLYLYSISPLFITRSMYYSRFTIYPMVDDRNPTDNNNKKATKHVLERLLELESEVNSGALNTHGSDILV